MTTDINGKTIRKGDKVRKAAWSSKEIIPVERRNQLDPITVLGIGDDQDRRDLVGRICTRLVMGGPVWERAEYYERVE